MENYDFRHFENSLGLIFCTIRYHSRLNMVAVNWQGTAPEEKITELKDEVLEFINRNQALFLLNDFQDLFTAPAELLLNLVHSRWDNEIFKAGVRAIVHVIKPEINAPAPTGKYIETVKLFYDKLEAVAWIEAQNNKLKDISQ